MKRIILSFFSVLYFQVSFAQLTATFDNTKFAFFRGDDITYSELQTYLKINKSDLVRIYRVLFHIYSYDASNNQLNYNYLDRTGHSFSVVSLPTNIHHYSLHVQIKYYYAGIKKAFFDTPKQTFVPYIPLAVSNIPTFCLPVSPFDLNSYVNSTGGTFIGTAVSGTSFSPVNAGNYNIVYKLFQKTKVIKTTAKLGPTGTFAAQTICDNSNILLTSVSTHTGTATYSGMGVSGSTFIPTTAGIGSHTITMALKLNGCTNSYTAAFNVKDTKPAAISFNNLGGICSNAGLINLNSYVSYTGGTFSGIGVSGTNFNPSIGQTGNITYQVGQAGCKVTKTASVRINPVPVLYNTKIPRVCTSAKIDLAGLDPSVNEIFSGKGVSGSEFNPVLAGVGTHLITSSYTTGANCTTSANFNIEVLDTYNPSTVFNQIPAQCESNGRLLLSDYVTFYENIGAFSGTSVELGYFYPNKAGHGTYNISYHRGSGGCRIEQSVLVDVLPSTSVTFSNVPIQCKAASIDLTNFVNVQGGTFSGTGVTGNNFDVQTAGIGEHIVNYSFTNTSGCNSSTTNAIEVQDILPDVSFNQIPDQCTSNERLLLSGYVNNYLATGTFSGTGVSLGYFYPEDAGAGTFQVKYKIGAGICLNEQTTLVDIYEPTPVNFTAIPTQCSANSINLANYVSQPGGTFTGTGVTGNNFDVSTAGIGEHEINYSYTNANNCTSINPYSIKVQDVLPDVSFKQIPDQCTSNERLLLSDYVNNYLATGTFSGTGIALGYFYPEDAGAGTFQIKYKIGTGICLNEQTTLVDIYEPTPVSFTTIPIQCVPSSVNLANYVSQPGGTFTGTGVTGNNFDVSTAGIGEHVIKYTYTNADNCTSINPYTVKVQDVLPDVSFNLPENICNNTPRIYLFDYVNYSDGSFSGDGVSLAYLEPDNLSDGLHSVSFNYGNNSCKTSISKTFAIIPKDAITALDIPDICEGGSIYLPDYVSPQNGLFSGTGVEGDYFNSELTGFGSYTLNYTFTSGRCTSTAPLNLFVRPAISADFYANDSSINQSRYVTFTPYTNNTEYQYHWDFGDNGFSSELEPIHYYHNPGEHTVSLTITDNENICSTNFTKEDFIHVSALTSTEELDPTNDNFRILAFGNIKFLKAGRYRVTDLTGRILLAGKNKVETIHLPLKTGIYIICFDQGRNYLTKRFFID